MQYLSYFQIIKHVDFLQSVIIFVNLLTQIISRLTGKESTFSPAASLMGSPLFAFVLNLNDKT